MDRSVFDMSLCRSWSRGGKKKRGGGVMNGSQEHNSCIFWVFTLPIVTKFLLEFYTWSCCLSDVVSVTAEEVIGAQCGLRNP